MKNNSLLARRLCSFLLAFSLLLPYIPSPAYAVENDESSIAVSTDSIGEGENIEKSPLTVDGEDISPEFNGNTDGEINSEVDDAVQDDSANSPSNAAEDGLQPEINAGLEVNNELDEENQLVLSEEFGMPENDEADYTPTITKQPQSVAEEKSAGRTSSLTVEAAGAGNGVLSYQWYEVGSSGDTALTDASATTNTYEASLKRLGTKSYYCIVTNTVNGKAYTVKSEVATVTAYMMYAQTLSITQGENTIFTRSNSWQGAEDEVTLDKDGAYTLTVLPMNLSLAPRWRMAVSYNGETAEAGAFQQNTTLDMSKFSKGTGNYFTVQIGYYNESAKEFTASELYKFNVTITETDYTPTITKQPQSVAEEKSAGRTTSLTVEAVGAGNGDLSYQWYEVGSSGDTALTDASATTNTYEASLKRLGTKSYYCIVTNTVNGQAYTVQSEVATVTVYQAYMATLAFCADNNVIASYNGSWQGGEFDVALCDLDGYDLRLQAIQFVATGSYSMTIGYNGEIGAVEPFKSSIAIDISKFTKASDNYLTIQIGNYSASTGSYVASETYRFNISIYPGIKSVTLTEDGTNIPVDVDFGNVLNSTKTVVKSVGEVKNGQLAVKIEPNKSSTQVYIGNSATPAMEQVVTLADHKTEYSEGIPYALVPVKLIAQSGAERDYTLMVQTTESHIKITQQPVNVICYMGDAVSIGVDAVSVDGGALSYQWYKVTDNGDESVTDADGANLAIQTNAVGETSYYCVITGTKGENSYTVKSDIATVTIKDSNDFTPVILSQPASRITCNQGDKITLSVEVLKPPKGELSYQWYRKAAEDQIVARTKDYIPSTDVNSTNSYYCVITNTVDGKEYKATTNIVYVSVDLAKYIHSAEIIGQPGTYIFDQNTGMVPGGYTAVAKGNSAPTPFNVRFQYVDYDVEYTAALYHSTTNAYDGAELVKDVICSGKAMGGYAGGGYWQECEINPNTAYPTGEHYFYVVITLSPSDKNSTVEPVSTKSDILKIDFTDRETTMDGAGTEQNPYIIKTTEHLSEIQKMVADGDSFAGAYFQIANDVSLPTNWTPIGTRGTAFSGHIDGNHKKLTVPAGEKPLLGCVNGASVKDLSIYGEQIEGAGLVDDFTGVGLSGSAVVLDNITLKSGSKTLKSGLVAAGAGNGYASASAGFVMTIRNCTIESNVVVGYTGTESQIGSFAGRFQGTIENCTSSATVKGKNYVGGIIGTRDNAMAQCVVKNSTFHGTVESSGSYAGGIVGGGYDNSTAPNGACPTILACTVDGTVKGNERVGGIFGGDGFVAQTWDNVVGSISANSFTGKVSGSKYVGAIIGYRNSLNRYDNISANTYSAGCGADKGIGFVKYLDTSYANPAKMDGTIVINTANGVAGCPAVEGCAWRADHNRTDDPLGKDADKLCRKIGGSSEPVCYELTVSGTYKTEYTVGDELNLTGIRLTASWTDGTTSEVALKDVTVEGYDKNKAGDQTVSLTYGAAKAYITVTVRPKSTKITVTVTVLGDSKHGDTTSPHGLARGGLKEWYKGTMEADTAETVWDVLQRTGLSFDADSNNKYGTVYIRAVNGLGEFDNGPNSGWMYTVNGTHPEVGVSARYLKDDDVIVLHYTDDYTYEEGGVNYGKPAESTATAKDVIDLIDKIGTVSFTDACKAKIDAARKAYDALSAEEKEKVTNYKKLTDAEDQYKKLKEADDKAKAKAVDDLISRIGTVTINSGTAINAAWDGYNKLTAEQKELVTKLSTLQEATRKWNQLKADEVIKLIDKIEDPVTEKSKTSIEAARKAYDALTKAQKDLVTNVKKLTDAETAYAKLTASEEDKEKAQEVIDLIDKLKDVALDSEKDIEAARKAYDALTDLQKKLVDNYDVLTAAEAKLAMLKTLGKVSDPYITTGDYMEALGTPSVGSIGGEWMVIGLARSDRNVPGVEDYYKKVLEYVKSNIDPETGRLHKAKSTDNSRIILALTAIGRDVTNVGGYDLLQGLSDLEFVKYQGNNGPIWALLALDSGNYPVPTGGTTTRQALIDEILRVQTSDGGWTVSGDKADSDMTGMALTALAPYYTKDLKVQEAIDKAIARLSEMQDDDGGFSTTYGDGKYIATSESTSQVLTALSALGIDADTDPRFVKNGSSVVDALLRYYVSGGGFKHIMDGEIDGMGTEQAYYALTAYYRFLSGKTNLYDMTDIIDMGGDVVTVEPTVPATTEPAQTNIPWWIIAVCIFGGVGWGIVIGIVLVPKIMKKKD